MPLALVRAATCAVAALVFPWAAQGQTVAPAGGVIEGEFRSAPPGTSPTTPAPDTPPESPRFDILEFVVEGNTVLSAADIEAAVTPHLGLQRRIEDVEAARKALEAAYQERGFQTVFVDVPEQKVDQGVVLLRVLQGQVERLRVTGSRYFSLGQIRAAVPELAPGRVPDFNLVQAQLAALNRSADRAVTPVLRQGRTPGTVEVELVVRDQLPLHGDIELSNRSSAFTSEARLAAGVRWENLWQRQHSAGLIWQTSPQAPREVRVLVLNYLWRLADSNDAWSFYAVRSNSEVALVGSSTILGKADIAGLRRIFALPAAPGRFDTLTAGADLKRFGQTNIATATQVADALPALDYVPLSLAYASTQVGDGKTRSFSVTGITAPTGVLGNRDAEFQGRRFLARAGWLALKFDVTQEIRLSPATRLWARLDGQWSQDPLISNEQFTVGGAESVRGYREAELAGDRGARAAIEWRWAPWRPVAAAIPGSTASTTASTTPSTTPSSAPSTTATAGAADPAAPAVARREPPPWYATAEIHALLDLGAVETVQPLGPQAARRWIGGIGAGLRWNRPGWRAQLEAARALNPGSSGPKGPVTDQGDWRAHLRLSWEF